MVGTDPSHAAAVICDPPTNELVEAFQVGWQGAEIQTGSQLHRA